MKSLGWKIDFARFRVYLREKYSVEKAFLFIGFLPENQGLYRLFRAAGFVLVFRTAMPGDNAKIKGNCDAEMVLSAMVELPNYDGAVIVSGDGDFACLAQHLSSVGKLKKVFAPCRAGCSSLFRTLPAGSVAFAEDCRTLIERRAA